jgi:hypothetical protein
VNSARPNTSLQRTRAALPPSPLSSKPLGVRCGLAGAIGLSLSLSGGTPSGLITRPADAPRRNVGIIYYDSEYLFLARDYGDHRDFGGNTEPGLFVHSSAVGRWLQVVAVSTRGATFGKYSSPTLSVGWDFTALAAQPYVSVPLSAGGVLDFPDRIENGARSEGYRLRFNSALGIPSAESVVLIPRTDLAAAFHAPNSWSARP